VSDADQGEIRSYYKGDPAYPPLWFQIYQAAGENPLEAQRLENGIDREWWTYHLIAQKNKSRAYRQMNG